MKRILHVGLGPLGVRILQDMHERECGHLVCAVDNDPKLVGERVQRIVPSASPSLRVLGSLDDVTDWNSIDAAIVATTSDMRTCAPTLRDLLARGKPVVSTCEELVYPWLRHVALAEELDELARRTGGRLLGTGVNPGFLLDALPVFATGVCKNVRSVSCQRIQDASARRLPFQKKIGAGLDDEQFAARVKDGSLRHVGLGESLHFISHYLGLPIERWDEDIAPVRADHDMTCALGPIPRGRVAGVRQVARGYCDERVVINLEFQAAIGQRDPFDRVLVEGEPPLDIVIRGGVHGDIATCSVVLNALPRLMESRPGLHTMATISPARWERGRA